MKWLGIISNYFQRKKKKPNKRVNNAENEYLKLRIEFLEKMLEEKTYSVDKAKSIFLKNLYHEIRTPLNAIVGFSNLIELNEASEKETADYLSLIKDSSQNFLEKMDTIIEASIIEAGIVKIITEECKIFSLLSELHSYFSIHKHICEKDIAFLLSVPNELNELIIRCDTHRIKQVLTNLLINAFKFTEKGVVEFGYKVVGDEMEFFVRDTGIGGLEGKEEIIYNVFTKLDESDSSCEGLGLGLSLANKLVELMDGKIRYTSLTGKGTTFYFTIPYKPVLCKKIFNERNYLSKRESIRKIFAKGSVAFLL
jgi:signal transduction histidine kinase